MTLGVVGAGVMGQTLIRGLIASGVISKDRIWAGDKNPAACSKAAEALDVRHQRERPLDTLVGDQAKERRLLQLDRKPFSERSVEYCIASRVGEISENDGVFFRQPPC